MSRSAAARGRAFLKGRQDDWRQETDESRGVPPPPVEEPWDAAAPCLDLPQPAARDLGALPVAAALARRRSCRAFADGPLTLAELGYLLWATQGVVGIERDAAGCVVAQYRTAPSGGARHPFETCLGIRRVAGIAPGVYRYVASVHRLVRMWADANVGDDLARACYGQDLIRTAAAVFVWTAVPYRTEWRYTDLAPRMVAIEAGHVCQNLYLAAESIAVGACAVLAYDQARMDALLCLEGRDRFTVYLGAVGRRAEPDERVDVKEVVP